MAEILTHIAFYAGWPNAWAAFHMAKEVYADAAPSENHGGFFGLGQPNDAYAAYFIGQSWGHVRLMNDHRDFIMFGGQNYRYSYKAAFGKDYIRLIFF